MFSFLFFVFCVFRTNGEKEHLDESNFCHRYADFLENVVLKISYLITTISKLFPRQLGNTLTTTFERHFTVEDFTEMLNVGANSFLVKHHEMKIEEGVHGKLSVAQKPKLVL